MYLCIHTDALNSATEMHIKRLNWYWRIARMIEIEDEGDSLIDVVLEY